MKKSTFIKVLSLIVGVVIIASSLVGALSAFADTDPEWAGTKTDGMVFKDTSEATYTVNSYGPVAAYTNLDFSKGLMYWCASGNFLTKQAELKASDIVTYKTDGDRNYVQFDNTAREKYTGIKSPKLYISGDKLKAGDKIALVYDINGDKNTPIQIKFEQRAAASGSSSINKRPNASTQLKVDGKWTTYATPTIEYKGTTVAQAEVDSKFALNVGDIVFHIQVEVIAGEKTDCGISNIRIAKVVGSDYYDVVSGEKMVFTTSTDDTKDDGKDDGKGDDTGTTTPAADPEWAGTKTDGMVFTNTNNATNSGNVLGPVEANTNLNFSKGLMYWYSSGKAADSPLAELKASAFVSYKTAGTKNYIQFDGKMRDSYCGIKTPKLAISGTNLKVGDNIVLLYDITGDEDSQLQFRIDFRNYASGQKSLVSLISDSTKLKSADGWTTFATKPVEYVGINPESANKGLRDGDVVFHITAAVPSNKEYDGGLTNLRIAKLVDNAYYDLYTGEKYVVETTSTGNGTTTGNGNTSTGTGSSTGTSNKTGEDITALACLLLLGAAGAFGTAKALKKR